MVTKTQQEDEADAVRDITAILEHVTAERRADVLQLAGQFYGLAMYNSIPYVVDLQRVDLAKGELLCVSVNGINDNHPLTQQHVVMIQESFEAALHEAGFHNKLVVSGNVKIGLAAVAGE
jgi:hypothetical protein